MTPRNALIIDDERDVATYLGAILTDNGWSVRVAANGNQGLEQAREQPPELILLDLMMPERGGLSTLVALRKDPRLASVPVIVVTAIDQAVHNTYGKPEKSDSYLARFKNYDADAFLEKPIKPERLLEVVHEVTAGSPAPMVDPSACEGCGCGA
ncbi:MAG: response regulator [bacterium]|nr:response regulator [bacterium]